ncbi:MULTISPECIES: hypothetical protein [Rhodomicrobium]|uniref:hypothetical protein n=1 Tax=Rhodomicrobium TaxID=1068 RepID=UPI000B4B0ABE|nr:MULTISPECIES: hypothetical protein [Rhodomicrobium]
MAVIHPAVLGGINRDIVIAQQEVARGEGRLRLLRQPETGTPLWRRTSMNLRLTDTETPLLRVYWDENARWLLEPEVRILEYKSFHHGMRDQDSIYSDEKMSTQLALVKIYSELLTTV